MNDDLNPTEEQFFDVFLEETLADQSPPDLSRRILRRLAEEPVAAGTSRGGSSLTVGRSRRPKKLIAAVSALAALAASWMFVVWLQSDSGLQQAGGLAGNTDPSGMLESASTNTGVDPSNPANDSSPRRPPRGLPLAVQPNEGESTEDALFPSDEIESPKLPPRQTMDAVTLVSSRVGSELESYWGSIGITPTPDASTEQITKRLGAILGVQLPGEAIHDPAQLRAFFKQGKFSRAIAEQWLDHMTDGGLRRIPEPQQESLTAELALSVRRGANFDLVLTRWLNGKSGNATAFFAALSAGRYGANDESAMVRRLASVTMNVDLRCTRCHDGYIDGRGKQDHYWSFASLLRRGVRRGDGPVEIDPIIEKPPIVFFETADGRQRVAEPEVPADWINRSDLPAIESVSDWTKTLVGSKPLARGVVNSLWQWVHGQPLHGRVVDPITAPHNEALDRLEDQLVEDLVRSRFDVARTLTLIISAPVTRRGVPEVLLPENALVANEQETAEAMNAVNAFAAAMPPRPRLSRGERVAQVLRSVGATIDSNGQPFVAQMGDSGSRRRGPINGASLASDFPQRTDSVPVEWLRRIEDPKSQIEHVGYLGGLSVVPRPVLQAAEVTREVEDNNTALHRTWWLVRP